MDDLQVRLHQAKLRRGDLSDTLAPMRAIVRQIEGAILETFPIAARGDGSFRKRRSNDFVTYTRDGIARRNALRVELDAVKSEMAPLKAEEVELTREVQHIEGLIKAEEERAAARAQRKQGELFT